MLAPHVNESTIQMQEPICVENRCALYHRGPGVLPYTHSGFSVAIAVTGKTCGGSHVGSLSGSANEYRYYHQQTLEQCTQHCLETPGCTRFGFGSTGGCRVSSIACTEEHLPTDMIYAVDQEQEIPACVDGVALQTNTGNTCAVKCVDGYHAGETPADSNPDKAWAVIKCPENAEANFGGEDQGLLSSACTAMHAWQELRTLDDRA